ncbi:phosphoribulokinase [uncultured Jannaschia sp.]|uniref:phosphoribulokinase n=1 Tax=uncultured Jannaschia sp. TaxID=293347 RepID=UPI0026218C3F|nr:phosphoribulokinase [uncultured Jannaschia sp.]
MIADPGPDPVRLILDLPHGRRLVALVGPPAAGKSTRAEALANAVRAGGRTAQVVPMDGFHIDNDTLEARGLRARKGSPATFDVAGLLSLVRAVRTGGSQPFPTFDRTADAVVPLGGRLDAEVAIFEGNYLLLDTVPWRGLHPFWDLTLWLDVPDAVLRERLLRRWRDHGFDAAEARVKAEGNDLPNAHLAVARSRAADIVLRD